MASKDLAKSTPGPQAVTKATPNADGEMVPAARGVLVGTQEEQIAALYASLGVTDPSQIEVIVSGKLPFWPAIPGALLTGVIQGRRVIPTRYKTPQNPDGLVGMYTVKLTKPGIGGMVQSESGKTPTVVMLDLDSGNSLTVLERAMLKEMENRVGQTVSILCVGKTMGQNGFEYWDYRVIGLPRTHEQIQSAALMAMAATQSRALPSVPRS